MPVYQVGGISGTLYKKRGIWISKQKLPETSYLLGIMINNPTDYVYLLFVKLYENVWFLG